MMIAITEPCPFCQSIAINMQTAPHETRAYGECTSCGARGPMAPVGVTTRVGWDNSAAGEWNIWARARAYRSQPS